MASQQYFGLAVLFTINAINFLDRISIAAVLKEIGDYYSLSHAEAGLLSTCFLVGYMMTAPIFGHFGDKYSRKWILVGGILFWILAAFSGSIIPKEYTYLFYISRMLVGVGEASYSTIAPTIISDLFEPEKRKLGLSIFYFAIPVGSGLGYLMGTLALVLGDWRWIFRITPAIGLVATLFLLMLKEPVRGQSEGAVTDKANATVMENIRYLSGIRSYVWATIGFTCCLFTMGALSWSAIDFMATARGDNYKSKATTIFGIIVFAAGFAGVTIGSGSAQYFRQHNGRADPYVCAAGIFVSVPLTFFGLILARDVTALSWVLLFLSVTALSTNWAVVSDMVLSVTVPSKRAFATAVQILLSHLFGDATSPFIVGYFRGSLVADFKLDEFSALLYALLSTLIVLTLGAIAFVHSARFYVEDVETCKKNLTRRADTDDMTPSDAAHLTDFAAP